MITDCHVHIKPGAVAPDNLQTLLRNAGVSAAVLLSLPPTSLPGLGRPGLTAAERLTQLMDWCSAHENLYPFFWIDPTEPDAPEQVAAAVSRGVKGFKVICNHFYPGDPAALPVYRLISDHRLPILFHSGILWDGQASSKYNRPAEFEPLIEIPGLRFALAHVSWPWVDECLAVYGKFLSSRRLRPELSSQMFIDLTPGTPEIYRAETLKKLLTIGYDVENYILFGSDSHAPDYDSAWVSRWVGIDKAVYRSLDTSGLIQDKIFRANFYRFLDENQAG